MELLRHFLRVCVGFHLQCQSRSRSDFSKISEICRCVLRVILLFFVQLSAGAVFLYCDTLLDVLSENSRTVESFRVGKPGMEALYLNLMGLSIARQPQGIAIKT